MRNAALAAGLSLLAVLGGAGVAHADVVTYACSPPTPQRAANCDGWHTTSVTLYWGMPADYVPAVLSGTDCSSPHQLDADTTGTKVSCAVWDGSNLATLTGADVTIQID